MHLVMHRLNIRFKVKFLCHDGDYDDDDDDD